MNEMMKGDSLNRVFVNLFSIDQDSKCKLVEKRLLL
jgi:hypothetical protein